MATPTRSSGFARRSARRLLRWYPRPWRVRYGVEMRELVDEMPVRWRQVADLATGAAREWASPRAFGWPARSAAARIQNARMLKFLFLGLVIEGIAHVSRSVLPADVGAMDSIRLPIMIAFLAAVTVRMLGAAVQVASKRKPWPLTTPEIAFWFVMLLVWVVGVHLRLADALQRPDFTVTEHLQVFIWANNLYWFSHRTKRLRRVYLAHLKRSSPALNLTASPITDWNSSEKRSSDRFW